MGHWRIRNCHYYGYETRTKYPPRIVEEMGPPWVAVFEGASYYEARKSKSFDTLLQAIQYVLSGGEPLNLTNTER